MNYLLKTTLIGLFFGVFGTTLGGIIGITLKKNSNRFLSFILQLAAGLMTSIICFDLIPEALGISGIVNTIVGVIVGIIIMIVCDNFVNKIHRIKKNSLLNTGIIVGVGLALHNFPEGLAIGSGFGASITLGYSLAVAILLHDIPEGLSMAIPLKNGGMSKLKTLTYTVLSGVTTGVGAFFGAVLGQISLKTISLCLSIAAGAMLYIVSGELIPESNNLYKGKIGLMGNILGFIIGLIAFNVC